MPRILFLTTAHRYNDDRIFYHQAKELKSCGYEIKICSLSSEYQGTIDGIAIESYAILDQSSDEKARVFQEVCNTFRPDCIIGSEPLAIIAVKEYRKKYKASLIYDITEWYPSMRMVREYSFFLKIFHTLKFLMIQLYAGYLSTHFIFGEKTKRFPLAYCFPFKKSIILPYFPDDQYIYTSIRQPEAGKIKLCYTGQISAEKGIGNFFNAVDRLRKLRPGLHISILIIGGARTEKDQAYFDALLEKYQWEDISIRKPASFETFTEAYSEADICFDLREINFENHHCLPIKIFYYAASGKPVIYSDLKATRQFVDISRFGFLVDPENADVIAQKITAYMDDPALYKAHAHGARAVFEEQYNWAVIKNSLTEFVKKSILK
ncbi:glycosyltransferase [uncultured Chryseobacterium sp.]|uniref:glycosyltransferase n=1 Tax=uncultured Chryseobacterium sp. TaxID=259322 RepID=UPI0025D30996|nr:glycosyltransferase [uncultured Chryseobacterium sp.]